MSSLRASITSMALGLLLAAPMVRADWQPPKDGVMTEKQLVNCLQIQKEALDNLKAAGKAIDGSQSGAAALAIYLRTNEKFKQSLAAHGMTEPEYDWVGGKTWEAYSSLLLDQVMADAQKGLADQKKSNQQKLAELKQKLAAYQKAQAAGRRVMSKDERDRAIQSARDDQQAALDEAKQHADEARQSHDEAQKADADAKAADAAATNPPADVSADDRPGFIDQKKSDAQQARDSAKDARGREADAKKAEAESRAKAAAAGKRMTDPDLPTTDEEKADVKKENEEQIASLKSDIDGAEQALKLIDESGQAYAKSIREQKEKNPIPPKNVELLKKHRAEFEATWGIKNDKK